MAKPQASRLRFALVWIPAPAEEGREAQRGGGMLNNLWFTGEEWIKQP
jgi:hypothetical protein